eukprot:CAMPEP_0185264478 /NCGR_PEP_ID=MMETSP1359-20130426/23207_1 /TAXON_ID=552665 /ORGANISM="Bigelowiella longifila, Strain CCMP242" /LENGTH=276 /DNA_ID=CAMNT_0027853103 /DNA_START=1 /DNA_END=831 /DNA_ORIENTATION=+
MPWRTNPNQILKILVVTAVYLESVVATLPTGSLSRNKEVPTTCNTGGRHRGSRVMTLSLPTNIRRRRTQSTSMLLRAPATKASSPFSFNNLFSSFLAPSSSNIDVESLKDSIRRAAKGTQNGVQASKEKRLQIAEIVRELEIANPTRRLTSSSVLDGEWKLLFTTNDGSSAGKFGPFVGDVAQNIDLEKEEYLNIVSLGNGIFKGTLSATWDNLSSSTWKVKFKNIRLELLGFSLQEKELKAVGTWRMTYLDDDFRILYAMGGKNQEQENIYILTK